jgi:ubiquitin carboxyl-terminal hydrolase 10
MMPGSHGPPTGPMGRRQDHQYYHHMPPQTHSPVHHNPYAQYHHPQHYAPPYGYPSTCSRCRSGTRTTSPSRST